MADMGKLRALAQKMRDTYQKYADGWETMQACDEWYKAMEEEGFRGFSPNEPNFNLTDEVYAMLQLYRFCGHHGHGEPLTQGVVVDIVWAPDKRYTGTPYIAPPDDDDYDDDEEEDEEEELSHEEQIARLAEKYGVNTEVMSECIIEYGVADDYDDLDVFMAENKERHIDFYEHKDEYEREAEAAEEARQKKTEQTS